MSSSDATLRQTFSRAAGAALLGAGIACSIAAYPATLDAQEVELAPEVAIDQVDLQQAPSPSFSSYDADAQIIVGNAPSSVHVVLIDSNDQVVSQTTVDGDGVFRLLLPDGVYSLDGYRIAAYDENWAQVGQPLGGQTIVALMDDVLARKAAEQLEQIAAAIKARPSLGLGGAADASAVSAQGRAEQTSMPVLPYALGAASALAAVGAGAGVAAVLLRGRRLAGEAQEIEDGLSAGPSRGIPSPEAVPPMDERIEPAASPKTSPLPEGASSANVAAQDAPDDLDDLERAAMAFIEGERSQGDEAPRGWMDGQFEVLDADPTDTLELQLPASSEEEFARMAKILATGTGRVHLVTSSTGTEPKERLEAGAASVVQDVSGDDWYAIALRELAEPSEESAASKTQPTADLFSSITANLGTPDHLAYQTGYVAPVVGPRALSDEAIERHMSYIDRAGTEQAAVLRERDDRFMSARSQRAEAPAYGSQDASTTALWLSAAMRGLSSLREGARDSSAVPVISRGAGAHTTIPEIEPIDYVPVSEPSPYGVAAAQAAVKYGVPDLAPHFGGDYAASIAANVYSESAVSGTFAAQSARPKTVTIVEESLAAAYASAVYASISSDGERDRSTSDSSSSGSGKTEAMRSLDYSETFDSTFSTPPVSYEYIDYMVQDEFEHRHDTTAQRNAALGRMRVVNGSAASPVPLDAGLSHLRHRA